MITQFVEVTDGLSYGKFLVCRLDTNDLAIKSVMPDAHGARLLTYAGRRRFNDHTTLIVDLQRGTAFAFPLNGGEEAYMRDYIRQHLQGIERLVCPLYLSFVAWLYEDASWSMGDGTVTNIPRYIKL